MTSLEKLVLLSVVPLTFLNTDQKQKPLQCSAILYLTTPNLPRPSLNVFNGIILSLKLGKPLLSLAPAEMESLGKSASTVLPTVFGNPLLANLTPNLLGFQPRTFRFLQFSKLATPLLIQHPPVEDVVAPDDHQETESSAEVVKEPSRSPEDTEERIKKSLNAFMCFAKEHRQKLWAEPGTSSAEINKILGQKWQELSPEERKKKTVTCSKLSKSKNEEEDKKNNKW
ncbi:unnamed protein product [Caenorhabditis nigoni]